MYKEDTAIDGFPLFFLPPEGFCQPGSATGPAHGLWRLTSPTEFHPYAKGSLVEAVAAGIANAQGFHEAAGIANAQGFHEAAGIDVVGRIGRAPNTRSRIRVMRRICDVERFDAEGSSAIAVVWKLCRTSRGKSP